MREMIKPLLPIASVFFFTGDITASDSLPLQEFECDGMLKHMSIYQDQTRNEGRRIHRIYIDGSTDNDFLKRVQKKNYISYVDDNKNEGLRFYPDTMKIEFWEDGSRIPDNTFATCKPKGPARQATQSVVRPPSSSYRCDEGTLLLSDIGAGKVRVKIRYDDGSGSEDIMLVIPKGDYNMLITEDSLAKETSNWGKSQGNGFVSHHIKHHIASDTLEYWSQGGGNMGPGRIYNQCR